MFHAADVDKDDLLSLLRQANAKIDALEREKSSIEKHDHVSLVEWQQQQHHHHHHAHAVLESEPTGPPKKQKKTHTKTKEQKKKELEKEQLRNQRMTQKQLLAEFRSLQTKAARMRTSHSHTLDLLSTMLKKQRQRKALYEEADKRHEEILDEAHKGSGCKACRKYRGKAAFWRPAYGKGAETCNGKADRGHVGPDCGGESHINDFRANLEEILQPIVAKGKRWPILKSCTPTL